jgi:hypothetical protein
MLLLLDRFLKILVLLAQPLGELSVRWTAGEGWTPERLSEEYEDLQEPVEEEQHAG